MTGRGSGRRPAAAARRSSAARTRAPSSKRGVASGERPGIEPAHGRAEEQLVGGAEALQRDRLLAHLDTGLAGRRDQRRAHGPGQEAPVERRRHEHLALRDPEIGEGRLENVAVEVDEQRDGAESLLEPGEQAPVDPLVPAEPAGEQHGRQGDRLGLCGRCGGLD